MPPQPSPKLRRLSIDAGIWGGASPREALEAGGYKLTRSFTNVNRRRHDGVLFGESTETVTEVAPLVDSHSENVNGHQQLTSSLFSAGARRKVIPTPGSGSAVLTFRETSNVSPPSEFFRTQPEKARKLISASPTALIDNKRTAKIIRPIGSVNRASPKSAPIDQEDILSDQCSEETTSTVQEGTQSSTSGDTKAEVSHPTEDLSLPLGELGDKKKDAVDSVSVTDNATTAPSSLPQGIPSAVAAAKVTGATTKKETSIVSTAATVTATKPLEVESPKPAVSPTEAHTETCQPTEDRMPSSRRESLRNRLSMEDATDHPHKTTVFIHEDHTVLRVLDDGTVKAEDEIIEDEEHSMFVSGRTSRRSSEPALGGHFLRELQERAMAEQSLSRSIQANLPSELVAEKDEDEAETEEKQETGDKKGLVDISDLTISDAASPRRSSNGHGDEDTIDKQLSNGVKVNKTVSAKSNGNSSKTKASGKEKERFDALAHRRRSDGDVLRFTKVFKVRNQRVSSGKTKKEAENGIKDDEAILEKDNVWDAVRRCRYIRGYDPPEMEVADNTDISEYVFGHRDPRSVTE